MIVSAVLKAAPVVALAFASLAHDGHGGHGGHGSGACVPQVLLVCAAGDMVLAWERNFVPGTLLFCAVVLWVHFG